MERWPRNTQKVIFLFYFLVENMPNKYTHMGLSFKFHFNYLIWRVAEWLRGIASVPLHPTRECFDSNMVNFFSFFYGFILFTRKVLGSLFSIKLNISFIYWYCTLCSFYNEVNYCYLLLNFLWNNLPIRLPIRSMKRIINK